METDLLIFRNFWKLFHRNLLFYCRTIISNRSDKADIETFQFIDQNNDGVLDKQELLKANYIAGNPLTEE